MSRDAQEVEYMMCCDYHNEGLSRTRRQTVRLVSDNQPSGTVDGPRLGS